VQPKAELSQLIRCMHAVKGSAASHQADLMISVDVDRCTDLPDEIVVAGCFRAQNRLWIRGAYSIVGSRHSTVDRPAL
jgi:hypothetical protein